MKVKDQKIFKVQTDAAAAYKIMMGKKEAKSTDFSFKKPAKGKQLSIFNRSQKHEKF